MSRLTLVVIILAMLGLARCGARTTGAGVKLTQAIGVSAGAYNTCAVQYGGTLFCWGNALFGTGGMSGLAVCTVEDVDSICAKRPGVIIGKVLQSSVGAFHNCANIDGAAMCWGSNTFGEIGDGTDEFSRTPVQVTGFTSGITSVEAGFSHSCAVKATAAFCWGENTNGELGDSTNTDSKVPVAVTGLAAGVNKVTVGTNTSCALLASGMIVCWGANTTGQLGDGTMVAASNTPVIAVAANATALVSSISLIPGHNCAIVGGAAKCWGLNTFGQLGDGTVTPRNTPTTVAGLTSGVTAITVGAYHSCAVVNGGMKCWGLNSDGQLGSASPDLCIAPDASVHPCSLLPISVATLDKNQATTTKAPVAIAGGNGHTCATLSDQTLECWGDNSAGQLGNNSFDSSLTPTPVTE